MITPLVARRWAIALLAGVATYVICRLVHIPSPELFGGLVMGLVAALTLDKAPAMPRWGIRTAQALLGISIGATVTTPALRRIVADWPSILLVSGGTLALSLLCGVWLAHRGGLSRITGVLSMIAGGAATLTSITRELGGDDRVVAVIQYLRVFLILTSLPLVVAVIFGLDGTAAPPDAPQTHLGTDLLFTLISAAIGVTIAILLPIATFFVFGPMIVAAVIAVGGWLGHVQVPPLLLVLAFVIIGLQVGLRFTRESLRQIRRLLPWALLMTLLVLLGSAGFGVILWWLTGVDPLTAYLATTPGGLAAVLAIAFSTSADATYVFAAQVFRLVLVLSIAPLLARILRPPDSSLAVDSGPLNRE